MGLRVVGYMSPQEWMEKADYEGGFCDGLAYGLSATDVDPKYTEFREVLEEAEALWEKLEIISDNLSEKYLEY